MLPAQLIRTLNAEADAWFRAAEDERTAEGQTNAYDAYVAAQIACDKAAKAIALAIGPNCAVRD